jgi:hypothetical protein
MSKLSSLPLELRISVPIEIIDTQAHYGFLTSPILGTDTAILTAWKKTREKVVKSLEGTEWRSIDVVHRDLRAGSRRGVATVVVTGKDADQPTWLSNILPRVRLILGDTFAVGLVWGDVRYSGDESAAERDEDEPKPIRGCQTIQDPRVSMDAFSKNLAMGASIGRAGHKGSRTAGGLIQLDWNDQGLVITNDPLAYFKVTYLHSSHSSHRVEHFPQHTPTTKPFPFPLLILLIPH